MMRLCLRWSGAVEGTGDGQNQDAVACQRVGGVNTGVVDSAKRCHANLAQKSNRRTLVGGRRPIGGMGVGVAAAARIRHISPMIHHAHRWSTHVGYMSPFIIAVHFQV